MCQMRTRITTLNRESENAASKIRISSKNRTSLNGESEQRVHCYGRRRNEQRREGLERERRECGKFWLFKLKSWSPSKVLQPPFSKLWCVPSSKIWCIPLQKSGASLFQKSHHTPFQNLVIFPLNNLVYPFKIWSSFSSKKSPAIRTPPQFLNNLLKILPSIPAPTLHP